MAEKVTFDGPNKLIYVVSGTSSLDVEADVYSAWKRWTTLSDNAKYLQAFRTFGGDPTASGQYAPKYFFLLNGWQIYLDGNENPYVDVALNLYVEGGGNPFILVNNATVSNTRSDVAVVESEIANILAYEGIVVYDEIDGVSGTTYPTGTRYQPVNNPYDLKTLLTNLDISHVQLKSDMNVSTGVTFNAIKFVSDTAAYYVYFGNEHMGFNACYFDTLRLSGHCHHSEIVAKDCAIFDLEEVAGIMDNCVFFGTIRIASGANLNTMSCASGIPGTGSPVIDMNPGTPTTLSVRGYSGGLRLINLDTSGDTATLEFIAGKAHIGASAGVPSGCTDGYVSVRGIALLNDWSSGTTVDTSALYETVNQYNNIIHYDETDGISGTTYPVGTAKKPVNNWSDAVTIMDAYGIHNVSIESNTTFTKTLSGKTIIGGGGVVYVNVGGQDLRNSQFEKMLLYGDWANSYPVTLLNCFVNTCINFNGVMKDCIIQGNISLGEALGGVYETSLIDCAGGDATNEIVFDMNSAVTTSLNIRRYAGDIRIINSNSTGNNCTVISDGGTVTLASSCLYGDFELGGIGHLINSASTNCNIDYDGWWDAEDESVRIRQILGLSQSNFIMTDQVYNVNNDLLSATVKTYPTAADADADTNVLATYLVTATYAGDLLSSYKVVKA